MANPSSEGYGNWDSGNQQWRSWVKIEQTAITDTTATYKVSAWMCAKNGSSSYASNIKGWAGIWDAETGDYRWSAAVNVGVFDAGDEWCFKEQSWTVKRTHDAQTVYAYADVIASAGIYSGRESNTTGSNAVTISLAAKTSRTISYSANGGSGAPASQTKWYGEELKLQSGTPTRSGYTFMGWATSGTTTTASYQPGASYTANPSANVTLYAVWRKAIKLTYSANGGSGAPAAVTQYAYNAATSSAFTLSSTKPTMANHTFLGWSTSSTATTATYAAGGSVTLSANTTLYAVWKVAAATPTISSLSAFRSTSEGAASGASTTYVTFKTEWSVDTASTSRSIKYVYKVDGGSATTVTDTLSASSDTTTKVVSVSLPASSTLSVTVTVTDSTHGLSVSKSVTVPVAEYPVTWANKGMSIGIFGMAAALADKVLQVFGKLTTTGDVEVGGALKSTGAITQGGTAVSLSGHKHAAGDVTSGTLALARGGTASDNSARAINTVFAGPSSGSAGNASWRKLVAADLPNATFTSLGTTSGTTAVTIDCSAYSWILVRAYYSTTYWSTIVIPTAQLHASTYRDFYLGGGTWSSDYGASFKAIKTNLTPYNGRVAGVDRAMQWQIWGIK